jgi:hypothetical protein
MTTIVSSSRSTAQLTASKAANYGATVHARRVMR